MVVIPDRASQRNNFQIIPLSRPRIERERRLPRAATSSATSMAGLCGDRRQALAEFAGLVRVERLGST